MSSEYSRYSGGIKQDRAGINHSIFEWLLSWLRQKPLDKRGIIEALNKDLQICAEWSGITPSRDEEFMQFINALPEAVRRENKLRVSYSSKPKPTGWGTTDPAHHNPDNFRYIVHATGSCGNDIAASLKRADRNELMGLLHERALSCSIIDELQRGTYKDDHRLHGFILDSPEDKIIAAYYQDMGSSPGQMRQRARANPKIMSSEYQSWVFQRIEKYVEFRRFLPSAQAFMELCLGPDYVGTLYNEIVVEGGDDLRIAGIYLLTDPILDKPIYEYKLSGLTADQRGFGKDYFDNGWTEAQDLAGLLNVPLVPIRRNWFNHSYWIRSHQGEACR